MVLIRDRNAPDQDNNSMTSERTVPPNKQTWVYCWILGYRRKFSDFHVSEKFVLVLAAVLLGTSMGLTLERVISTSGSWCRDNSTGLLTNVSSDYLTRLDKQCAAEFTFAWVTIIHCLFSLYYLSHGLFWVRWYELIVFLCNALLRLAYTVGDFIELNYHNHPADAVHQHIFDIKAANIGMLAVTVLAALAGSIVAFINLRKGFILAEFPPENRDQNVWDDCKRILLTRSLRTFNTQFQATFLLLIICHVEEFHWAAFDKVIVIIGFVYLVGWNLLVTFSLRRQSKCLAYLAVSTVLLELLYYGYKIVMSSEALATSNHGAFSTHSLHFAVCCIGSVAMFASTAAGWYLYITARDTFGNERAPKWHKKVYPDIYNSKTNEIGTADGDGISGASATVRNMSVPLNSISGRSSNYGATTTPYEQLN